MFTCEYREIFKNSKFVDIVSIFLSTYFFTFHVSIVFLFLVVCLYCVCSKMVLLTPTKLNFQSREKPISLSDVVDFNIHGNQFLLLVNIVCVYQKHILFSLMFHFYIP